MYIICRGRTGIPSYSDLLQCNEGEEKRDCLRNKTEIKETSGINEREEKKETEEKPCRTNKREEEEREETGVEDHNYAIELNMYVCAQVMLI